MAETTELRIPLQRLSDDLLHERVILDQDDLGSGGAHVPCPLWLRLSARGEVCPRGLRRLWELGR
jgi:hypothetical protein